ncbi:hypothetical protein QTG54_009127 [Skeletonema marinoi]|uniref:Uncharacterized protein n=1 Tax=Skeletonema marinoi TaxID=267567 RepID=A0AAD8Y630_9STRA|nr:hypothetical protein QTG54_009127 [Skeletonema marinoi]
MPTPIDNGSSIDVGDSSMTTSPSSSSNNNDAAMVTAHSDSVPSPPPAAMNNADVTAHHPHDDGDVAMDDTTNNSSAPPTQPNSSNSVNDDADVQMSPRTEEAVNPTENLTTMSNDLESSSAPLEQSVIPASNPTKEDGGERKYPEELSLDDSMEEDHLADEEMNSVNLDTSSSFPTAEQRRRDDNHLDDALDKLQHSISEAILAFRKEEQGNESMAKEAGGTNNDGSAYVKLRDAAVEAYQTLVEYGSLLDLSLDMAPLNKRRCEKLEKIGRDLWKIIRTNPDLFNDVISDVTTNTFDIAAASSMMEQKRQRAIAGGYIRTIAVRLIFLQYIDTRCSKGCPPTLHDRSDGNKAQTPSPKELVFGLKVLSKGGRAILQHGKTARDSHDALSLAISCFNVLSGMAQSNGEAANEMKDVLLDEAFDVYSALPNAAALFEKEHHADMSTNEDDASTQADNSSVDWPTIVLKHLDAAKNFIDEHCNEALNDEGKSALKYAALQRFLPQLARLC